MTEYFFIGKCCTEGCSKKDEEIKFKIPVDKVKVYQLEPEICAACGKYLNQDIRMFDDEYIGFHGSHIR